MLPLLCASYCAGEHKKHTPGNALARTLALQPAGGLKLIPLLRALSLLLFHCPMARSMMSKAAENNAWAQVRRARGVETEVRRSTTDPVHNPCTAHAQPMHSPCTTYAPPILTSTHAPLPFAPPPEATPPSCITPSSTPPCCHILKGHPCCALCALATASKRAHPEGSPLLSSACADPDMLEGGGEREPDRRGEPRADGPVGHDRRSGSTFLL